MIRNRQIPWPRVFAERTAIVLSILFAFWIDAWWSDRQDIVDEHVMLQAFLDDLQEKKIILADGRRYNEAILEAVIELLHKGNNPASQLAGKSLDQLVERTWWYNNASDWDSAAMQSLISGGLATISNPQLLQNISELQISFSLIKSMYRNDESFHHNTYTPFLIENAYLPQLVSETEYPPGKPEVTYSYPHLDLSITQDHTELLRQKNFHNMLVAKMDRILDIMRAGYIGVDELLDETIGMLSKELAD